MIVSFHKKTLFLFFEGLSICLYNFFSLTWSKGFMWLNKFLNLCFQGTCKQIIKGKQASNRFQFFSFEVVLKFDFWLEGQILEIFEPKEARHFPNNIFQVSPSHILFFQRVGVFVSMCVCGQACVCVCIRGQLEDLAKETNLQMQSNVISMLGLRLVTTPTHRQPSSMLVF